MRMLLRFAFAILVVSAGTIGHRDTDDLVIKCSRYASSRPDALELLACEPEDEDDAPSFSDLMIPLMKLRVRPPPGALFNVRSTGGKAVTHSRA